MKVKDVMIKNVITLLGNQSLADAAKILVKNNISGAPVVDAEGKVIGMVSEKDLFTSLYPDAKDILEDLKTWFSKENIKSRLESKKKVMVSDLMSKEVVSVCDDDSILQAGSLMLASNIHRLPVIKDEALLGIVSRRDIFRKLLKANFEL